MFLKISGGNCLLPPHWMRAWVFRNIEGSIKASTGVRSDVISLRLPKTSRILCRSLVVVVELRLAEQLIHLRPALIATEY